MNGAWVHPVEWVERVGPRIGMGVLSPPSREVGVLDFAVDIGSVGGIADHHRPTVGHVDDHALVADRVARRGYDPYPFGDVRVAIDELEARSGEVEPTGGHLLLPAGPLQL